MAPNAKTAVPTNGITGRRDHGDIGRAILYSAIEAQARRIVVKFARVPYN
jgi:hypothetical protein